jgi:hypothetical protein
MQHSTLNRQVTGSTPVASTNSIPDNSQNYQQVVGHGSRKALTVTMRQKRWMRGQYWDAFGTLLAYRSRL